MEILYNIGNMDIFRNLRFLLLIISTVMTISAAFKLKRIISNYNYINREVSMLENLKNLSDKEFISWLEDFLESKGYYNLTYLEEEFYTISDGIKENLVFIDRKYNILDKVEGKYILGYSHINSFGDAIVITTGKLDKSFYNVLDKNNLNYKVFSKSDFERSYREFVLDEI